MVREAKYTDSDKCVTQCYQILHLFVSERKRVIITLFIDGFATKYTMAFEWKGSVKRRYFLMCLYTFN